MTTQHTPTPWAASGVTVYGSDGGARNTVADTTCCGSMTREADEANAAFIVRAVNSHDALVAAVTMVLDADGDLNAIDFDQLRAALARVRS